MCTFNLVTKNTKNYGNKLAITTNNTRKQPDKWYETTENNRKPLATATVITDNTLNKIGYYNN